MSQDKLNCAILRLALPKGRMQDGVYALMAAAGIAINPTERGYRPCVSLPRTEMKLLKPQNIVEMLELGSRDVGFAGADWVKEMDADVVELLDTGLDPVQVVAAAPNDFDLSQPPRGRRLLVASEYERLTQAWIQRVGLEADFLRSFGATEVFPPEDADIIVDNTATGRTLRANDLVVIDRVLSSSTRLYAHPCAMMDPDKRGRIEDLRLLLESVLEARRRVMLEVNVPAESLDAVVALLPSMREATVSSLFSSSGYAVKAAVPRDRLTQIIPALKAAGGSDVVVIATQQIVP